VVAISCCLGSRTVHALLRQGEGQEGRKRLGQQPSHVTSGLARYSVSLGGVIQDAGKGLRSGGNLGSLGESIAIFTTGYS
jgi:hypothetical protein